MLNMDKQTLHVVSAKGTNPSLLALRRALLSAAEDVPARPYQTDRNELLAQTLINRMQNETLKPLQHTTGRNDAPYLGFRLKEVIGEHV